jgi:hypothetical protein
LTLALASGIGLAAVPAPSAQAAEDSAVTVVWAGGNAADLQALQPERDPASIHYQDFKDLKVTVSRTQDLVDEALAVRVEGMPGPTRSLSLERGDTRELGASFVHAMQCWGDPADPEFYKNCLFGAWQSTPYTNNAHPKTDGLVLWRAGSVSADLPFRAVSGQEYSSLPTGHIGEDAEIFQVVRPENTNERHEVVDAAGAADFLFEAQSAAGQPYLGCGATPAGAAQPLTRCWLVVVPRGLSNSPATDGCPIPEPIAHQSNGGIVVQQNSPINPACDYWANRLVIPLDFRPVGGACAAGGAERLMGVSETAAAAFQSWQAGLCQQGTGAYAMATAADSASRGQLVSGQLQATITARPVTAEYLPSGHDPDQLAAAEVVYAPVAVTGVTIAFLAVERGQRTTQMRLSPRLVAKLVTHSYALDQTLYFYNLEGVTGPWKTNPYRLNNDPEFQALNPEGAWSQGGVLIMTGPNGADAIAQLWAYLQADDAARAFLSGEPDNVRPGDEANSGMTINPYHLPKGHADAKVPDLVEGTLWDPNSRDDRTAMVARRDAAGDALWREVGLTNEDGSPRCLCDAPLDTFIKPDETPYPQMLSASTGGYWTDISQLRPYAANLEAAAKMVFRADIGSKGLWDSSKWNGVSSGAYVSNGQFNRRNMFLEGFTDVAGAARYGLATAALGVPNRPGEFTEASPSALAAAVAAQSSSGVEGVTLTDPADLPAGAYPLTQILYAAVNLTGADAAARAAYADLIEYAATDGQASGHSTGQLPEGYLPLTEGLTEQALAAANAIRAYAPESTPTPTPTPTTSPSSSAASASPSLGTGGVSPGSSGQAATTRAAAAPASTASTAAAASEPQTGYSQTEVVAEARTEAASPPGRSALGGSLAVGVCGLVAGPLLLRRRGVG